MKARPRSFLFSASTAVVAFVCVFAPSTAEAAKKKKNPTSKAYVADLEGTVQVDNGERIEDLSKKSVFSAEGTVIETKPNSNNAMVLSNGTGIFFDPDTRLEVKKFLQEPFSPVRTDLEVEPSISQTQTYLPRGTVGLCTSKLVAGSTMNYKTPLADVSIRGRKVVIQSTEDETRVSLLEGDVTVRGESFSGGEMLKPGQQAIIRRGPVGQPPIITIQNIPQEDKGALDDRVTMACMARKTVYFDVAERKETSEGGGTPGDVFEQSEEEQQIRPVEVVPTNISAPQTVSADSISAPSGG